MTRSNLPPSVTLRMIEDAQEPPDPDDACYVCHAPAETYMNGGIMGDYPLCRKPDCESKMRAIIAKWHDEWNAQNLETANRKKVD